MSMTFPLSELRIPEETVEEILIQARKDGVPTNPDEAAATLCANTILKASLLADLLAEDESFYLTVKNLPAIHPDDAPLALHLLSYACEDPLNNRYQHLRRLVQPC